MEKVMAGVKTYIKAEDKMFYKYQYHTNIPDSTPTRSPSSPWTLWAWAILLDFSSTWL